MTRRALFALLTVLFLATLACDSMTTLPEKEPAPERPQAAGTASDPAPAGATSITIPVPATEPPPPPTEPPPTPRPTRPPRPTATAALTGQLCGPANALWIGTFDHGLSCLDEAGWHSYVEGLSPLPNNMVKDIAACEDGRIWIVHLLGVSVIDGADWLTYDWQSGIDYPERIACDNAGGVWLARYGAVSHFDGASWTSYEASLLGSGDMVDMVKDVAVDDDGRLWLATGSSVATFDGANWTVFEEGQGFDGYHSFDAIAVDGSNRPWVSDGDGVLALEGDRWVPPVGSAAVGYVQVERLLSDGQDRMWLAAYGDGLIMHAEGSWSTYNRENSAISSDHVQALAVDRLGRVWAGTVYGLNVLGAGEWRSYLRQNSGLLDDRISALAVSGNGPPLPDLSPKAPGSLAGAILRDGEPVAGTTVELCSKRISEVFVGPSPCHNHPLSRQTLTDEDGRFVFTDVPVGRYWIAFLASSGEWLRLVYESSYSEQAIGVEEGVQTDLGVIYLSE